MENVMTRLSNISDQTIIPQSLNLGEPSSGKTQFPKRSKVNHSATASIAQPTLNAFNIVLLLMIVIVLSIVVAIAVATAVIVICCVFQMNNAGANRSQNKNHSRSSKFGTALQRGEGESMHRPLRINRAQMTDQLLIAYLRRIGPLHRLGCR